MAILFMSNHALSSRIRENLHVRYGLFYLALVARLPEGDAVGPFARLLENIRGTRSLTQLAAQFGVSQEQVSRYRRGALPSPQTLQKMKRRVPDHAADFDRYSREQNSRRYIKKIHGPADADKSFQSAVAAAGEHYGPALRNIVATIAEHPWLLPGLVGSAAALIDAYNEALRRSQGHGEA